MDSDTDYELRMNRELDGLQDMDLFTSATDQLTSTLEGDQS